MPISFLASSLMKDIKKPASIITHRPFEINYVKIESGSYLLSRAVTSQVPSAQEGLTTVFEMRTGGSLPP